MTQVSPSIPFLLVFVKVQGKASESIAELMDVVKMQGLEYKKLRQGQNGKDKLWTKQKEEGEDLGTRDKGEDWKGPMREATWEEEKGPI